MGLRKLMAGIAAAATLLGGAMLGTASAYAEDNDATQTITIMNGQQGHTYKAYKVADFSNVQFSEDGETITSMDIDTVDNTELVTALKQAIAKVGKDLPAEYENNPMAFVATLSASEARTFANYFNEDSSSLSNGTESASATIPADSAPGAHVMNVPQGWYLITDSQGDSHFKTALVASTVSGKTTFKTDKTTEQSALTDTLGSFYVKSENAPNAPEKNAYQTNEYLNVKTGTVNIGDTVYYQVRTSVPLAATGRQDYTIRFTDTAQKGLKIGTDGISVCHKAKSADKNAECTAVSADDLIIDQTGDDSSQTVTKVTVRNVYNYVGEYLYLRYSAVVTSHVLGTDGNGRVLHNEATVAHNTDEESEAGEATLYTGDLKFYKYGVNGSNEVRLNGAEFTVHRGQSAAADEANADLKFTKLGEGVYQYDPANGSATVATGNNGLLILKGLEAGYYTFVETKAPAGYADNFKPTFTVNMKVTANKASAVADPAIENPLTDDNNGWGLASSWTDESNSQRVKVKNVKSITQLPLTGGAGIILFSVIAALLVAVAAVATIRIRAVKRELQD